MAGFMNYLRVRRAVHNEKLAQQCEKERNALDAIMMRRDKALRERKKLPNYEVPQKEQHRHADMYSVMEIQGKIAMLLDQEQEDASSARAFAKVSPKWPEPRQWDDYRRTINYFLNFLEGNVNGAGPTCNPANLRRATPNDRELIGVAYCFGKSRRPSGKANDFPFRFTTLPEPRQSSEKVGWDSGKRLAPKRIAPTLVSNAETAAASSSGRASQTDRSTISTAP